MIVISDKLIALREMELLASKHLNSVLQEIQNEIAIEESIIWRRNITMQRKKLIGK